LNQKGGKSFTRTHNQHAFGSGRGSDFSKSEKYNKQGHNFNGLIRKGRPPQRRTSSIDLNNEREAVMRRTGIHNKPFETAEVAGLKVLR
jgi:hypothetical protein